jgi:hypothetical protein
LRANNRPAPKLGEVLEDILTAKLGLALSALGTVIWGCGQYLGWWSFGYLVVWAVFAVRSARRDFLRMRNNQGAPTVAGGASDATYPSFPAPFQHTDGAPPEEVSWRAAIELHDDRVGSTVGLRSLEVYTSVKAHIRRHLWLAAANACHNWTRILMTSPSSSTARHRRTNPVMHGDDDQIVPYRDAALLSVKLLKHASLKIYARFSHGMLTINADVINHDLLAFIRS